MIGTFKIKILGGSIPIWRSKDGKHEKCIGSIEELKEEIDLSIGFNMKINPLNEFIVGDFSDKNYNIFDLHKPYVDDIVLALIMEKQGCSGARFNRCVV